MELIAGAPDVPACGVDCKDAGRERGAPGERRRFLDITLATTSPRYIAALQRYRAALVRRNAALRDAAGRADAVARASVWEPALAEHGAVLWFERAAWVDWARPRLAELCEAIGERAGVTQRYVTSSHFRKEPEGGRWNPRGCGAPS